MLTNSVSSTSSHETLCTALTCTSNQTHTHFLHCSPRGTDTFTCTYLRMYTRLHQMISTPYVCNFIKTWAQWQACKIHLLFCFVGQVADFAQVLQQLPSNSLLAAAFVTYLGREAEEGRQAAVTHWCSLLGSPPSWSLTGFLSSETELLTWKTEGLSLLWLLLCKVHRLSILLKTA